MSYRKRHVKYKIHRIKPKISIFKRLWFWIAILILIIISFAAYFALFYSGFQLKNVVISGNVKVKTQDLQSIVSKYAATGLINFWDIKITSGSIFLINEDRIKNDILEKFPEIEKLTIAKNFPQTLTLDVAERKPLGVFCDNNDNCFLIDQNGVVFEPIATAQEVDILRLSQGECCKMSIVRQSAENGQVFAGQQVVPQDVTSAIAKIQKSLKDNFQIDIKEALIASSMRLNITTNENWQIYFDSSSGSDINLQITKLDLLLNGGMSAASRKNLRYIDLRPKDRAIICDNSTCGG